MRPSSPKGEDQPLKVLRGHKGPVISVEFNHSGSMLCSGSHDGTVLLWNVKTWTILHRLESISGSPVWSCHMSSDSSLLAMGCGDGRYTAAREGGAVLSGAMAAAVSIPSPAGSPAACLLCSLSPPLQARLTFGTPFKALCCSPLKATTATL